MGFRMNLYEKDGKTKLSYSTFEDFEDLNFSKIIEKRKEPFQLVKR